MPSRIETYRQVLRSTPDVVGYLRRHSGLPGPRGNLELAHAFALEGTAGLIRRLSGLDPARAPENTPEGFLAFCGVLGLGRLIVEGDRRAEAALLRHASDPRWRVREAVAAGAQLVGDRDRKRFQAIVTRLARGGPLDRRAAVAAVAEPRLLKGRGAVRAALRILEDATRTMTRGGKPLTDDEKVLRQALAYAWSVVVAADPATAQTAMEAWLTSKDPDVIWLMTQNLKKARLKRALPGWTTTWLRRLSGAKQAR